MFRNLIATVAIHNGLYFGLQEAGKGVDRDFLFFRQ
jgi:hypothetical protein